MFMMYALSRSELMYTKCIQSVCIQNISHILTNFCIHFVCKMNTKCIQNVCIQNVYHISTKFNWHSSFYFVYKMCTKILSKYGIHFVYILYTLCIYQLHTSCTIFVYKMYIQFPCGNLSRRNYQNQLSHPGLSHHHTEQECQESLIQRKIRNQQHHLGFTMFKHGLFFCEGN